MTQETTRPLKKRRRWLRRIGWTLLVLVAFVVVVRVVAGYITQHMLNGRLEALRASGERLRMSELAPPEVSPERNAAVLYVQAFAVLDLLPERSKLRTSDLISTKKPLTPAELDEARSLLAEAKDALRLLHEGAAHPECRYAVPYDNNAVSTVLFSHHSRLGAAQRLLALSVHVDLAEGKADAAAQDCLDMLRLAESTRNEPLVISMFLEFAYRQLAGKCLEAVLDRSEPSRDILARAAAMLSAEDDRERRLLANRGERCMGIELFETILRDPGTASQIPGENLAGSGVLGSALAWVFRPVIVADFLTYLDAMGRYQRLAHLPFHESRPQVRALADEVEGLTGVVHPFSRFMVSNIDEQHKAAAWSGARRECARVAVALRLHRLARGTYPDALAALVPEFLSELPKDPMTGTNLLYRREGQGFVVYSIGLNGKDDGGLDGPGYEGDIAWHVSR